MMQLGLFDICRRKHGGNAQSEGANMSVSSSKHVQRSQILGEIQARGGATCDELEQALALSHQTCSARCSELLKEGAVKRIGVRMTRSGRNAAILGAL